MSELFLILFGVIIGWIIGQHFTKSKLKNWLDEQDSKPVI